METPEEIIAKLSKELNEIRERVEALEDRKQEDARAMKSIQNSIKDLELRVDKVSLAVRELDNSLKQSNANFQAWHTTIMELVIKTSKLEERLHGLDARFTQIMEFTEGLDTRVSENFAKVQNTLGTMTAHIEQHNREMAAEIRTALPVKQEVEWYKDHQKIKEIGAAVALLIVTVLTAVNTLNK